MSGVITAIGVAASVASAAYSISKGSPQAASGSNQEAPQAPTAAAAPAQNEVDNAASKAATARSQLLETAGGSAGSPLASGDTSKPQTIFGN